MRTHTGERPTGERPAGERPTGERPTSERPSGERYFYKVEGYLARHIRPQQ
jgi:hypothetical protein